MKQCWLLHILFFFFSHPSPTSTILMFVSFSWFVLIPPSLNEYSAGILTYSPPLGVQLTPRPWLINLPRGDSCAPNPQINLSDWLPD